MSITNEQYEAMLRSAHIGKKVSLETTKKALATKIERYGSPAPFGGRGSWSAGWVEIGGKRFFSRSSWEVKYANHLELLKKGGAVSEWLYEPMTFWFDKIKRGVTNYTPDFKVIKPDGTHEWHEVKGWMDKRSITKLKRMRIYHPKETVIVRDGAWFKANKNIL